MLLDTEIEEGERDAWYLNLGVQNIDKANTG
jgi:hypothetical protein